MEGSTGVKTATTEQLSDAVAVMDPFPVVRLAGRQLITAPINSMSHGVKSALIELITVGRPILPRDRRPQYPTTRSTGMSLQCPSSQFIAPSG